MEPDPDLPYSGIAFSSCFLFLTPPQTEGVFVKGM